MADGSSSRPRQSRWSPRLGVSGCATPPERWSRWSSAPTRPPVGGGRTSGAPSSSARSPPTRSGSATFLDRPGDTRAVFATYHSLGRVTESQAAYGAQAFNLAIADEAHRTTGVDRSAADKVKVDFQEFHDDARLHAAKRLYMTATPRIYGASTSST